MVFFVTAAMGIVPLLMIAFLVFERPEHYGKSTLDDMEYAYRDEIRRGVVNPDNYANVERDIVAHDSVRFLDFFKNPSYIAIIFVNITLVITLYGVLNWIPFYLSDTFHFKLKDMGWWSSLYFVAGAVGSFSSAYLSDKVFRGNRQVMIMVSFTGLAPFIFLLSTLSQADPILLAMALFGMGFFANMGWGPLTSIPAEIFSPEVYGRAMGFVNGASYMITAFSAKIFSQLVIETPTGKDYTHGWYFIGMCVVVGLFAASFIKTPAQQKVQVALT
jgi:sugar phosphate permease